MCIPVIPADNLQTPAKVGSKRPISRWRRRCGWEATLIGRIPYIGPHRLSVNTVTIHDMPFGDHLSIYSGFVLLSGSIFSAVSPILHSVLHLVCCHFLSTTYHHLNSQLHLTSTSVSIFIPESDTLPLFPSVLNSSNKAPPFHRAPSPHLPWRSTEEENPNHAHAHAVLPAIPLPLSP